MSKPNEYEQIWIIGGGFSGDSFCDEESEQILNHDPKDPCSHFIKYSAYEALQAKIEILESKESQYKSTVMATLEAKEALQAKLDKEWHDGYPNKLYGSEWFIAETKQGDKVFLKALLEEFSYDYKTADDTYFKKEVIARWMQSPDSKYIPFEKEPSINPVQSKSGG